MRWQAPPRLAPGTIVADQDVRSTDPREGLPRVEPRPVLDAETAFWSRPAATVCFPIHPLGVMVLIDRAIELAQGCMPADEKRRDRFTTEIARVARLLYAPGVPIRAALDRFVDQRSFLPPREPGTRSALGRTQLSLLASHHVLLAALALAEEAK